MKKKMEKVEHKIASHVLRGRVVSAKLHQTVSVLVEMAKVHPFYGKAFKRSKKYLAHTTSVLSEGDIVELVKSKPFSKNKHFLVLKVVGKDIEAVVSEQLKEEAAEAIAEVMPEEKEETVTEEADKQETKLIKGGGTGLTTKKSLGTVRGKSRKSK